MNDSRFKELLNLYLDHEISPSDAAALEQEVRAHPERKRTFDQYCQLQKGSRVLFETQRLNAPGAERLKRALADANRRVEQPRTNHRAWWLAGGGFATLAAAACVAFVITRSEVGSTASAVAASQAPKAATVVAKDTVATRETPIAGIRVAKPVISYPNFESKDEVLKWTQTVQFRPVKKVESLDLMLKSQSGEAASELLPAAELNSNEPSQMTAIQFKR